MKNLALMWSINEGTEIRIDGLDNVNANLLMSTQDCHISIADV
jgi:hypothetical protein